MGVKKLPRACLRILLCIVVAILIVALAVYAWYLIKLIPYYRSSEKIFRIPGIDSGFVPQGLYYEKETDTFFVSGYQADGSASPVYLVDGRTGGYKRLLMQTPDGKDFAPHAGGICAAGKYVYVAGSGRGILAFDRAEIDSAPDGSHISYLGIIPTPLGNGTNVSMGYLTVYGGRLYGGEFFREENYKTPESHKIRTAAGDYNQAIVLEFELSDGKGSLFGVKRSPAAAYSVTDMVQGICVSDGVICLSTSYGAKFSHLNVYSVSGLEPEGNIAGLPLFVLDSASLVSSSSFPPAAEGIAFLDDGRLCAICESASDKFFFGKLLGSSWCCATDPLY